MFGTVMRAKLKPGHRDDLISQFSELSESGQDDRNGFISAEIAFEDKDPDRVVVIVHFQDREGYFRNADDPETNTEYERMLEHFEGPPEWIDVNYQKLISAEVGAAS